MALTNAALEVMGDALAGAITHVSLHSADPGGTGANEVGTRLATSWDLTDPDGDITDGPFAFTGLPASGAVTYVGFWSALTAGTFYGSYALTGDQAANAAGEYTVNTVTLNGSST